MSINALLLVHDFHTKFGLAYLGPGRTLEGDMLDLRVKRLKEEANELLTAKTLDEACDAMVDIAYIAVGTLYLSGYHTPLHLEDNTVPNGKADLTRELEAISKLADLCHSARPNRFEDLLSILYLFNRIRFYTSLPLDKYFEEVHAANMRKERGTAVTSKYGNSFDIVKPAGWTGPDGAKVLKDHGFNPEQPFSLEV